MSAKQPTYPPTCKTLPNGRPNPNYDPNFRPLRIASPPPPPIKYCPNCHKSTKN